MLQSLSFCLVYTVRAMQRNPDLAVIPGDKSSKNRSRDGDDDDEGNNDNSEDEEESSGDEDIMHMDEYRERQEAGIAGDDATFDDMSGANWIIQRLRGIGADSRGHRRIHVMKVFLMLIEVEKSEDRKTGSGDLIHTYIHQIIDVAVRSSLAAERANSGESEESLRETKEVSALLLNALEVAVGSSVFIGAFGTVQSNIQQSKTEKKRQAAAEAITNPQSYANRKIENAKRKKEARKRQIDKHAKVKGLKKRKGASVVVDYDL